MVLLFGRVGIAADEAPSSAVEKQSVVDTFINEHCLDCHRGTDAMSGVALDSLMTLGVTENAAWERVYRKLATRQMPPSDAPRPAESEYRNVVASLGELLDRSAAQNPRPGRTETFRRLNRTEYQNAIRDLLALEIDAKSLLPADDSSHGFDNITVTDLSPALLNRYLSAAQVISRKALGRVDVSRR